ncbi:MucR family transcriptional regulator [Pleomorphomonas sp. PLEO]|uniref:MucR family transcriptional regulator n=1 Tax=Pleomorphomonas sp. PLEO TaxID=3239306 RepID=UPI00351E39D1
MNDFDDNLTTLDLAASIVAAYVGHNSLPVPELPALIASVHATLARVRGDMGAVEAQAVVVEPAKPAVSVKKSVTPDYLICLEDGKKFKSLKRHLRTHYNLSPDEYRAKWNLPSDYPMVAPTYAEARSNLAKQMGLGQQRKRT